MSWREFAPAKVNLTLQVCGRRSDGRHDLDSLVVFVDVGDVLEVDRSASGNDEERWIGPFGEALAADLAASGAASLTARALATLRAAGASAPPCSVQLEKVLPIAAGLGGGTGDAAALLHALDAAFALGLGTRGVGQIMGAVGSDGAACAHARPLRMRGAGERIDLIEDLAPISMVLVNPGVPVSTSAVFAALSAADWSGEGAPPPQTGERSARALIDWTRAGANDLEAPALNFAPVIAECRRALIQAGAGVARMSGSGASVFGLFERQADAEAAASALARAQPDWWVRAAASYARPSRAGGRA